MIIDIAMRVWMTVLDNLLRVIDAFFDGVSWIACTLFWLLVLRWMKE